MSTGRIVATLALAALAASWPASPPALGAAPAGEADGPLVDRRTHDELVAAKDALGERDYETASRIYWDVLVRRPDLGVARVGHAVAEMKLGRDAMAMGTVLDGLARERKQPALLELLGDLRNREEQVEEALRAWREAFELAPDDRLRDKIFKAARELEAGRGYALAATSHFTMRYDGQVDERLSGEVVAWLEQEYWNLADAYDHAPPQPITVLLYPSREFRDVTQAPEWVGGLYDGKIRVPLGGLDRLNPAAKRLLTHELAHAVIHSASRGACPRWLHEGLAQIAEGRQLSPAEKLDVARRLAEATPESVTGGPISYPMALSMTRHLESRRGFDGLVRVVQGLGRGLDVDAALREVYGEDYAGLLTAWSASVAAERAR